METIQEIAKTLRCTERMAAAFANSVQQKVGQEVQEEVILRVLKRLNPRSIEIGKVVTAVKQELGKAQRRASRRRTTTRVVSTGPRKRSSSAKPKPAAPAPAAEPSKLPPKRTQMEELEAILDANWRRAEKDGFKPERMNGVAFIHAVHRHTDPRDATKSRILRACEQVDKEDILITPTAVADIIRLES